MICNELYDGQGFGNQLWNYVVTRIIADKKSTDFSILGRNHFKGSEFMDLDFGKKLYGGFSPEGGPAYKLPHGIKSYYREKRENYVGKTTDISRTDFDLYNISDNTKIDGNFQSTKYLDGYRDKIIDWLKVDPKYKNNYFGDNACIIHLRCGDFASIKDVFLPPVYYKNAIEHIKKLNPDIKFYCVTDQKDVAKSILPEIEIIGSSTIDKADSKKASHHYGGPIGIDFSLMMNAKYLIIPNSSFSWWASYLNTNKKIVIAPKFWAAYNNSNGYWSTSDIITEGFTYLDKENKLYSPKDCWIEKEEFEEKNKGIFYEADIDKRKMPSLYKIIFLELKKIIKKIIKFRKNIINKPKVYDIFTFFNELDLLEMRLNILNPYVDYFVIVESTETFSGQKKPLYFKENQEKFAKWKNKIIHYVVDDYPNDKEIVKLADSSPNVPKDGAKHWHREFYQKESIKKALKGLKDDDVCFVGDVDEIWNYKKRFDLKNSDVFKLKLKVYSYFLNNRSDEDFAGTIVTKYRNIRNNCLNHLRSRNLKFLKDGGWHFTNMGGVEQIRRKLDASYTDESYNTPEVQTKLEQRVLSNQDYIGRKFRFWIDEKDLPKYILDNKEKYAHLIKKV